MNESPNECVLEPIVRRVWFTMVLHPAKGWMRAGKAYGSRKAAREWVPFVRVAWRGLRVKVSQCTLRWVNGQLDERSRRTLDEKFNMDAPNAELRRSCKPSPPTPCSDFCLWTQDSDGNWETACGQMHVFFDGTPHQNNYDFCPYCGKRLTQTEGEDHE